MMKIFLNEDAHVPQKNKPQTNIFAAAGEKSINSNTGFQRLRTECLLCAHFDPNSGSY